MGLHPQSSFVMTPERVRAIATGKATAIVTLGQRAPALGLHEVIGAYDGDERYLVNIYRVIHARLGEFGKLDYTKFGFQDQYNAERFISSAFPHVDVYTPITLAYLVCMSRKAPHETGELS